MADHGRPPESDDLVRGPERPSSPRAPAQQGLPVNPEAQPKAAEQRVSLERQLTELEGTLRFMGRDHPRRVETERQASQVRLILERLNASTADKGA